MKSVRCAVYTRKSSEDGLEQGFNSLDAQREACAAYILSQASEGWVALPDIYDDGGISGGTLERPALQRLLAEVRDGRIDIIVVYKVDRLTRSLLDFAKLVEAFDKADTSFVSITQSFNTTTSMGRLTLNMLLSFAQFEREVTAERIRDKIAASKAKGMWMGGTPPIGYEPDGRTLKIVEPQAAFVRDIFQRYLELGNVRLVADGLERDGVLAPQRQTATGKPIGGGPLSRGQIYKLLSNPLYIAIIAHNGHEHKALHEPIIDLDVWERAQRTLAENLQGHRTRTYARNASMLAGKVVDEQGEPLIPVHATKGTVRYRYYVSRALQDGRSKDGWRVPARELEGVVAEYIARAFDNPLDLIARAGIEFHAGRLADLHRRSVAVAASLRDRRRGPLRDLVERVQISDSRVSLSCNMAVAAEALGLTPNADALPTIELTAEVRLTRSGLAVRLIDGAGCSFDNSASRSLGRLIAQGRAWWEELRKGQLNVTELAVREGTQCSYITRVLRLAFLSPEIVDAVVRGTHPASMNGSALLTQRELSPLWSLQKQLLDPDRSSRRAHVANHSARASDPWRVDKSALPDPGHPEVP